jgi:hypothetical protein
MRAANVARAMQRGPSMRVLAHDILRRVAYLALPCVILQAGCAVSSSETTEQQEEALAGGDARFEEDEAAALRAAGEANDHHGVEGEDEPNKLSPNRNSLSPSDPVSSAATQACTTTVVWGLATQLVQEIGCMKPGSMKRIDDVTGLSLGSATFPYLQTSAATALVNAQKVRGVSISINSGLRTLPQQYLLYRWDVMGRCGIAKAAKPGSSNHESGIAVDIASNASWKSAMTSKGWRWLGSSDPVHFDYVGSGSVDMSGLSVRAFQRLWNRNNPNDKITEDGQYDGRTEARLVKSPVGGFPRGASCL